MYTLRQNNDTTLNVPRDDGLSGGDPQVLRDLLHLGREISEQDTGRDRLCPLQLANRGSA